MVEFWSPSLKNIKEVTQHKIGSMVFLPNEDKEGRLRAPSEGHFYKVTGHKIDKNGRLMCKLHLLISISEEPKYMADHITEPFRRVTSHTQALWANPTSREEREAAVDLLQVKYETKRVSTKYSPTRTKG